MIFGKACPHSASIKFQRTGTELSCMLVVLIVLAETLNRIALYFTVTSKVAGNVNSG